jgi:hypothetical protein
MAVEQEFGGKVGRSYEESEEWWPEPVRPHPDAPNVIVFLLDDVGFAQMSRRFGGLIDTPNIDRLADTRVVDDRSQPAHNWPRKPLAYSDGIPRLQCDGPAVLQDRRQLPR